MNNVSKTTYLSAKNERKPTLATQQLVLSFGTTKIQILSKSVL